MFKFFKWGRPTETPPLLPSVPNMGMQAQPLHINLPVGSPERTLRCLHRMTRIHQTLAKHKGDPGYCAPFEEELARRQMLMALSGDTGPYDVPSLFERIENLEAS